MKKIVLLLVFLYFISCSAPVMNYHIDTSIVDYSIYSQKIFFITESNSVNFEYSPLGSLCVGVYSGKGRKKQVVKKNIKKIEDDIYPNQYKSIDYPNQSKSTDWKSATVDDALNEIYDLDISIGANGIINLKVEIIPESTVAGAYRGTGIRISGMAINKY